MADEVKFENFTGINNVASLNNLTPSEFSAATNVDVDDNKNVNRRNGYASMTADTAPHSLASLLGRLFWRSGTALKTQVPGSSVHVLASGFGSGRVMRYAESPDGRAFLSDGSTMLVSDGETTHKWGIDRPTQQPGAAEIHGSLPAGRYLFALTFLRPDGEESGTPVPLAIQVSQVPLAIQVSQGGISFSNMQESLDPSATRKALYLSKPGGAILYRAMILSAETSAVTIDSLPPGNVELDTQDKSPPPLGTILAIGNGRALVAWDGFLSYSDKYRYERFDLLRQVIPFPGRITLVAILKDAVIVGTNSAIWRMNGPDIESAQQEKLADFGAIEGSLSYADGQVFGDGNISGRVAVFASTKGLCVAVNGGMFKAMTLTNYRYPEHTGAASVVRADPGLNHYLVALH